MLQRLYCKYVQTYIELISCFLVYMEKCVWEQMQNLFSLPENNITRKADRFFSVDKNVFQSFMRRSLQLQQLSIRKDQFGDGEW